MLKDMKERCPNFKELHLHFCNTDNITSDSLPPSLKKLVLHRCTWKPRWLRGSYEHLPNLKHLDLSCSSRVDSHDMEDVIKWPQLTTLILNGCYRINDVGIQNVVKNLSHLTRLELRATRFDELSVHHMSRNLKELTHLSLDNSLNMDDSSLETLASGCKKLEYINLIGCKKLTIDGLLQLKKCKHLRQLLCDNTLEEIDIENLHTALPRVEIQAEGHLYHS